MKDVFVEQIIKRNLSIGGLALRVLSIFILLVVILLIPWLGMLGITITALVAYVVYLAFVYTSVEYEYSLVNGELTVDRILGKRKRKPGEEYNIRNASILAKIDHPEIANQINRMTRINYCSGKNNDNIYAMILDDVGGVKGPLMVTFEPNEDMLDAIYHIRPNIVKK